MRIALAQIRSVPGDVSANLAIHESRAAEAAARGAGIVVFPELSLTGYEPHLAAALASRIDDGRWAPLQRAAQAHGITIGAGLPTPEEGGVAITHAFFHPDRPPTRYSKQFLHPDETPFFVPVPGVPRVTWRAGACAFAICYELAVPAHTSAAFATASPLFLASVAKSASGMAAASVRLAELARTHRLTTALVNTVGPADNFLAAGGTAAWGPDGQLLASLGQTEPGLLVIDVPVLLVAR